MLGAFGSRLVQIGFNVITLKSQFSIVPDTYWAKALSYPDAIKKQTPTNNRKEAIGLKANREGSKSWHCYFLAV